MRFSSLIMSCKKVDFPEPEGPMRKTNSPLSIVSERLSSAGLVDVLYDLVTLSNVITLEHLSQTTVAIETFVTNGIKFDAIGDMRNDAHPHPIHAPRHGDITPPPWPYT